MTAADKPKRKFYVYHHHDGYPEGVGVDLIRRLERADYARAGIPAYLVVDLTDDPHRITLFEQPESGDYTRITGGARVTLTLPEGELTLTPADLTS